ncbi:P-loop containing nucleoside triphosphate hydrolase protein, partial [Haematococcus lacustris]
IPFHNESALLSAANNSNSYYEECWLRGVIQDEDDVQELVSKYGRDQLLGVDNTTAMVQQLLEKRADPNGVAIALTQWEVPAADLEELADIARLEPTAEQLVVLERLRTKENGVCVVSGGPGTGKTFLTKQLLQHLRVAGTRHLATATTGAAAIRLSKHASTVHTAFGIFGTGRYLPPISPTNPRYEAMRAAKVIIIDEMSMLCSQMFSLVLFRLQQCCECRSFKEVLEQKLIILVGDHAQLPPVCHCKIPDDTFCKACHISSDPRWEAAEKLQLQHSVRHAEDPEFVEFLTSIRRQRPTQEAIDDMFRSYIVSEAEVGGDMQYGCWYYDTHVADCTMLTCNVNAEVVESLATLCKL